MYQAAYTESKATSGLSGVTWANHCNYCYYSCCSRSWIYLFKKEKIDERLYENSCLLGDTNLKLIRQWECALHTPCFFGWVT